MFDFDHLDPGLQSELWSRALRDEVEGMGGDITSHAEATGFADRGIRTARFGHSCNAVAAEFESPEHSIREATASRS